MMMLLPDVMGLLSYTRYVLVSPRPYEGVPCEGKVRRRLRRHAVCSAAQEALLNQQSSLSLILSLSLVLFFPFFFIFLSLSSSFPALLFRDSWKWQLMQYRFSSLACYCLETDSPKAVSSAFITQKSSVLILFLLLSLLFYYC